MGFLHKKNRLKNIMKQHTDIHNKKKTDKLRFCDICNLNFKKIKGSTKLNEVLELIQTQQKNQEKISLLKMPTYKRYAGGSKSHVREAKTDNTRLFESDCRSFDPELFKTMLLNAFCSKSQEKQSRCCFSGLL